MLFKPKYMLQNMASRASGPLGSLGSRLAGWLFGPASEPTLSLAQLASLKSLARLGSSWPAREALRAGSALCQPWCKGKGKGKGKRENERKNEKGKRIGKRKRQREKRKGRRERGREKEIALTVTTERWQFDKSQENPRKFPDKILNRDDWGTFQKIRKEIQKHPRQVTSHTLCT